MTNSVLTVGVRSVCIAFALAAVLGACSTTHGDQPSSSGSHWLTCKVDADCTSEVPQTRCDQDGLCRDRDGKRVVDPRSGADAGAGSGGSAGGSGSSGKGGASGSGTSGSSGRGGSGGNAGGGAAGSGTIAGGGAGGASGGGSGGSGAYDPCEGKGCGDDCKLCAPGDSTCVETEEVKRCDIAGVCTGSPVSCDGMPASCASSSVSPGDVCTYTDDRPVPECCSGTDHLRCAVNGCTPSIPGECVGTWQPVGGSRLCGLPKSCTLGSDDGCASGQVCCTVGRCGPIERDEGWCELADLTSGECVPCACEKQPGGCPICNSPDTPIATPDGERAIAELREGDLVLSMDGGQLVAVPVLATRSVRVFDHAVVRLVLDSGRTIEVSGSHPAGDGRRLDSLAPGDLLGDATVQSLELVPYTHERTYDILPASDSGTYVAGGALLGSTLWSPPGARSAAR